MKNKIFLISRTDSIGDVILTLPICAWLKENYPTCKIIFLGRSYTLPILENYVVIDSILDWDELQKKEISEQINLLNSLDITTCIHVFPKKEIARLIKKAKIKERVGTSHRLYHWFTCNIRPNFTRKNSDFHEAQLNFELLRSFGLKKLPTKEKLIQWTTFFKPKQLQNKFLENILLTDKKKVILHPKSQGSAVEWPIENYYQLALQLAEENFMVFFSGTENEGLSFRENIPEHPNIIDISGKSSLSDFISFIGQTDVLVACSTGPLHIAATLGIKAIGLYTDLRPMHPGRWAPIGKNAKALTIGNFSHPQLDDIRKIAVESVVSEILIG